MIWFCRECKRKGIMLGKNLFDIINATREHKICSPSCQELIRMISNDEVQRSKDIEEYQDWTD